MRKLFQLIICVSLVSTWTILIADGMPSDEREIKKSVKKVVATFAPAEEKEVSIVDRFKYMFTDGKVNGQLKSMYADYDYENGDVGTYATAIGGTIKYELAEYNGFNAGAAFSISHDINAITGNDSERNSELSSLDGSYTELTEAYINYTYQDLNIRVGRQIIDTPLADSDDIRMIANTFEAYIVTYDLDGLELMAGNLQRWQGVDAGLDSAWDNKTGENGTWFGGISYADDIEFSAWYYHITKSINAFYIDAAYNFEINHHIKLHVAAQYLNEREVDNSGTEAEIYGFLTKLIAYDFGFHLAYNRSDKKSGKKSFSGFGGGILFTNMDTMILDEIADDRGVRSTVAGISYHVERWRVLYAYGDFDGDANSAGTKAHIVEQNMGFEYEVYDNFYVGAFYVIEQDRQSPVKTENDWDRFQVMAAYNF